MRKIITLYNFLFLKLSLIMIVYNGLFNKLKKIIVSIGIWPIEKYAGNYLNHLSISYKFNINNWYTRKPIQLFNYYGIKTGNGCLTPFTLGKLLCLKNWRTITGNYVH